MDHTDQIVQGVHMQAWIDEYAQCCMLIEALVFFLSYPGFGMIQPGYPWFCVWRNKREAQTQAVDQSWHSNSVFYWTYELFVKQLAICQVCRGLKDWISMMGLTMAQMAFSKSNWKTITHYHFRLKGHNLQRVSDFKDHRYHRYHTQLHFVCIQYTYRS